MEEDDDNREKILFDAERDNHGEGMPVRDLVRKLEKDLKSH